MSFTARPRADEQLRTSAKTGTATDRRSVNPAAVTFKLPDQIEWKTTEEYAGLETAMLAGIPSKPGLYVVMAK
jgi:hypothetical protein